MRTRIHTVVLRLRSSRNIRICINVWEDGNILKPKIYEGVWVKINLPNLGVCCLVSDEVYGPQIVMNRPRKPHAKQGNKHLRRTRFIFVHSCFLVYFRLMNRTVFPIQILRLRLLRNLRTNVSMCKHRLPVLARARARAPLTRKPALSAMRNIIQSNHLKEFFGSSE